MRSLATLEIERIDWSSRRTVGGFAVAIPGALKALLEARTAEDATKAYWKLENHVVVQGQLFDAALAVVPVLLAALAEPSPGYVRVTCVELLFQIVHGEAHTLEVVAGNAALGAQCRDAAREGLWLLYRELLSEQREGAREVIEVIERSPDRLEHYLREPIA